MVKSGQAGKSIVVFIAISILMELMACGKLESKKSSSSILQKLESVVENEPVDAYQSANALLVIPRFPKPGEPFRIVATGGKNIIKADLQVTGPTGKLVAIKTQHGNELPCWRIDEYANSEPGNYQVVLLSENKQLCQATFTISSQVTNNPSNGVWKTIRSWDPDTETLYSAWVNALFEGSGEQTSWSALHEVTQNSEHNFLYNYLQLGEDDPSSQNKVVMEPDCADNPFLLRAYFAWKLGLPFGFHICDRGYLGKSPQTGQWITNESVSSKKQPVQAFNNFLRMIMNGVHSGTARTALENENADYYPVSLNLEGLRPGTIYADPYGHTLILVSWVPQTKEHPGLLLSVDAQPDKTIAIKRFWKGNFLFNTSGVVGEPGFKAFRPIVIDNGHLSFVTNKTLAETSGYAPFSLQQKNMQADSFYRAMDRVINSNPLEAEDALMDLIDALHGQLEVRVKSVATGERYMQEHPGAIIPMPANANAIFQAGGQWEDFSTPNRDLRLLIAIDAVLGFPDKVAAAPADFRISKSESPSEIKQRLQSIIDKKVTELTIRYTRSDGSEQVLTVQQILDRRAAFEIAYNPNDGPEIRWGAPENSAERSTCKRHAPANQQKTMQTVRTWFNKRLHPPT